MRREPQRIQRRRTKGWRMPDGAVYVGRPTRWGNPYRVGDSVPIGRGADPTRFETVADATDAVRRYRRWINTVSRGEDLIPLLRGRDLCCWCPLDQPCHADVLLEIANGGPSDAA